MEFDSGPHVPRAATTSHTNLTAVVVVQGAGSRATGSKHGDVEKEGDKDEAHGGAHQS